MNATLLLKVFGSDVWVRADAVLVWGLSKYAGDLEFSIIGSFDDETTFTLGVFRDRNTAVAVLEYMMSVGLGSGCVNLCEVVDLKGFKDWTGGIGGETGAGSVEIAQ